MKLNPHAIEFTWTPALTEFPPLHTDQEPDPVTREPIQAVGAAPALSVDTALDERWDQTGIPSDTRSPLPRSPALRSLNGQSDIESPSGDGRTSTSSIAAPTPRTITITIEQLHQVRDQFQEAPTGLDKIEGFPIKGNPHYDELMDQSSRSNSISDHPRSSWKGSPRTIPPLSRNRSIVRRHGARDPSTVPIAARDMTPSTAGSRNAAVLAAAEAKHKEKAAAESRAETANTSASDQWRDRGPKGPGGKDNGRSWRDRPAGHGKGRKDRAQQLYEQPAIVLKQSSNAWRIGDKAQQSEMRAAEGAILVILNKLTPETFAKLSETAGGITITDPATLQQLCKVMFEKAISEVSFASLYAQFIARLSERLPSFTDQGGAVVNVRSEIIKRCYNLLTSGPETPIADGLSEIDKEEAIANTKRDQVGNVVLMGELFKHGILAEPVVHVSIKLLFEGMGDIETLVPFLQTVGKFIDKQSPEKMDDYFVTIAKMSKQTDLATRLRFMLMDLIDLRRNRWRLRREKVVDPKMLDEVRKATTTWTVRPPAKKLTAQIMRPAILRPATKAPWKPDRPPSNTATASNKPFSWEAFPMIFTTNPTTTMTTTTNRTTTMMGRTPSTMTNPGQKWNKVSALMERRIEALIREHYSCLDMAEAIDCVRELPPDSHRTLITKAVLIAFDMKDSTRILLKDLLDKLVGESIVSSTSLLDAVAQILQDFDDVALDLPRAPTYLSNLLGDLLGQDRIQFQALLDVFHKVESGGDGLGNMAINALARVAAEHGGNDKLLAVWGNTDPTEFKRLFQPKQLVPMAFKHNLESKGLLALPF